MSDEVVDLPNGFVYASEGEFYKVIEKQKKIGDSLISLNIPSCIIDFKYNDEFIIALQMPMKKDSNSYSDNISQYNQNIQHYWIIKAKEDKVFGPLTLDSFEYYRKLFVIPSDLKLKNE